MSRLDICLLVPLQGSECAWIDDVTRHSLSSVRFKPVAALRELEAYVGRRLRLSRDQELSFYEHADPGFRVRTSTAISLATSLERGGLAWQVLDPSLPPTSYWREALGDLRSRRPRVIGISTTYITTVPWLEALCAQVRKILPESVLLIGGPLYTTDAKGFLGLDADILLVGEGEERIVEVVRAVRDGAPLEGIPGLYLRREGQPLHYTGYAAPLDFGQVALPDWSLADRIEPPVDLTERGINYAVETQRGCPFKCEFCTFRTSVALSRMPADRAALAISKAAARARGVVYVVDATGTHPKARWVEMMEALIAQGGSPTPISTYARVSDIDDRLVDLMERAGIRHIYVGQESGDQRILNAMKKGTRVDQVAPAIAALRGRGIVATFSFIHGFPGETAESLGGSRDMLLSLNVGAERSPVVPFAMVDVFRAQDFAAVSQREELRDTAHQFGYEDLTMPPRQAAEATLETLLALSRVPHAPATGFGFNTPNWGRFWGLSDRRSLDACFHWLKAVDRGVGVFLAREIEGKKPELSELRPIKDRILADYPAAQRRSSLRIRLGDRLRSRAVDRVTAEWDREQRRGVGPLTRLLLGHETYKVTGELRSAARAVTRGVYGGDGWNVGEENDTERARREELAEDLISQGLQSTREKKRGAPS